MNQSFHIQPIDINTANADLFVEISEQGLSFIILDHGICMALVIYQFEAGIAYETAAGYIHEIVSGQHVLQQKFNTVHIIYGYAPSVLVPQELMVEGDKNALLELVYSDAGQRVTKTQLMQRHGIQHIYGIPTVIDLVITRYFDAAEYNHLFTLLPDVVSTPGNHLYCIFGKGILKVLLIKEGKLQVMQSYTFKTPEDVAYHLLTLCKSFGVKLNTIQVQFTGMIDVSSALYSELYKYFLHIHFEALPEQYQYPEEINQHPTHYYSHLFSIAACV